jgi:hypothetical protein
MDKQAIFDKVWKHFVVDGGGYSATGICNYRDGKGNSCAVGCLIPDELYDPLMEGSGLMTNPKVQNVLTDLFGAVYSDFKFFQDLQLIHDGWYRHNNTLFIEHMRRNLLSFAAKEGLKIND